VPRFVVRHATEADHPVLRETIRALNTYEQPISGDRDESDAAAAASLDVLLRRVAPAGAAFVAETEGRFIGHLFCVVEDAPPYVRHEYRRLAVIAEAFVADAWRGRGVFRALLASADAHARAAGCRRMMIGVLAGNDRAERVYRAAGFRPYAVELIRDLDDRT
jgi:GNAT superfamily N-acetyltransferase